MSGIELAHVAKNYGPVWALEDINVTIGGNRIYGLLGRNGAGKTTLLNLICARLFPASGSLTVDGEPIWENESALAQIFCMTEQKLYPDSMRVGQAFAWTKKFYPSFDLPYAQNLAAKFGLRLNKRLDSLSTGYSTIAKLILALAVNVPYVLYDEPVLGLDANHRELFYRELLQNYIDHPKTVVISTHIIEEIADLLEQVIIVKGRRIEVEDSVENLLQRAYTVSGSQAAVEEFSKGKNCIHLERLGAFAGATIMEPKTSENQKEAARLGLETSGVELQKLFIHLTNGEEAQQ